MNEDSFYLPVYMILHGFHSAHIIPVVLQPDSPAELGNKIYEMMAIALGGRWSRSEDDEAEAVDNNAAEAESTANADEATDPEVVEPSEVRAENDPWNN